MRAFDDEPRNFKPWSCDEDGIIAGTPSPNYNTTSTGEHLSSRQTLRASSPYSAGLLWFWARTGDMPATIRYLDC
ncbi:hypothetical protein TNCV_1098301 [Trichonephila clavipes]|nr:hypothetical protein TNCV_1098301 [Trichonephila clavipes]